MVLSGAVPPKVIEFCEVLKVEAEVGDAEAVYEDIPGWKESTVGIRRYEELPAHARRYLERLQILVGVPITIISTGPDRDQTIIRQNPFG